MPVLENYSEIVNLIDELFNEISTALINHQKQQKKIEGLKSTILSLLDRYNQPEDIDKIFKRFEIFKVIKPLTQFKKLKDIEQLNSREIKRKLHPHISDLRKNLEIQDHKKHPYLFNLEYAKKRSTASFFLSKINNTQSPIDLLKNFEAHLAHSSVRSILEETQEPSTYIALKG